MVVAKSSAMAIMCVLGRFILADVWHEGLLYHIDSLDENMDNGEGDQGDQPHLRKIRTRLPKRPHYLWPRMRIKPP